MEDFSDFSDPAASPEYHQDIVQYGGGFPPHTTTRSSQDSTIRPERMLSHLFFIPRGMKKSAQEKRA